MSAGKCSVMFDCSDKQLRTNLDKLIVFGVLLNDMSKSFDYLIPELHLVDLCISWFGFLSILRILTGKKQPQKKNSNAFKQCIYGHIGAC